MGSAGNPAVSSLLPASFITKSDDAITPAGRRGREALTNNPAAANHERVKSLLEHTFESTLGCRRDRLRAARLASRSPASGDARVRADGRLLAAASGAAGLHAARRTQTASDRARHARQAPPDRLRGRSQERLPECPLRTAPSTAAQRGRGGAVRLPERGHAARRECQGGGPDRARAARRGLRAPDERRSAVSAAVSRAVALGWDYESGKRGQAGRSG
jgi:hypothetical protein